MATDKRTRLARIACHAHYGHGDEPCHDCKGVENCVMWEDNLEVVDAILGELMEPGEGAKRAGFAVGKDMLWEESGYHEGETLTYLERDAPGAIFRAILTAIREGK